MWVAFAFTKATHIFSAKNTCELDIVLIRAVNILTTNELTMLWTTGPRWVCECASCFQSNKCLLVVTYLAGTQCWNDIVSMLYAWWVVIIVARKVYRPLEVIFIAFISLLPCNIGFFIVDFIISVLEFFTKIWKNIDLNSDITKWWIIMSTDYLYLIKIYTVCNLSLFWLIPICIRGLSLNPFLLNPDIPCLCKQCRSRSVGFWTDLDLHCLPLSMWIYSNKPD